MLLRKSLRAEAGLRRSRMHQRIANRVSEREKELKEKGLSEAEIEKEKDAIRAAGKAEEEQIEAVRTAFGVVWCGVVWWVDPSLW